MELNWCSVFEYKYTLETWKIIGDGKRTLNFVKSVFKEELHVHCLRLEREKEFCHRTDGKT